jgi:hypothetical protein
MRNIPLKYFAYIFVGISAVAWISLAYLKNIDLSNVKDLMMLLPNVVTIDLIILGAFVKWGWRLKIFQGWLVPFPDLNGTWLGTLRSDWINYETGKTLSPIPIMVTIKQSFFHISSVLHTEEDKSYSYSEEFIIDQDRQKRSLAYIYSSEPNIRIRGRSQNHDGACILAIKLNHPCKLIGNYWTQRKTTGEIALEFHSKEIKEEIPIEIGHHPLTQLE